MNQIVAIRYIDALFYTKKDITFVNFPVHIAIGRLLFFSENYVTLSFTEKNNVPQEGLLILNNALILNKNINEINQNLSNLQTKINSKVGIYWNDIVHFTHGKIPENCAVMYSEGELFSITLDAIIIKNPQTVMVGENKLQNHPNEKVSFIVIPKKFITSVELYDKEL